MNIEEVAEEVTDNTETTTSVIKRDILVDVVAKMIVKRKILNLPQYEVAKKAGVSSALVNLFEKRKTNISLDKLELMANTLGLKVVVDVVEI